MIKKLLVGISAGIFLTQLYAAQETTPTDSKKILFANYTSYPLKIRAPLMGIMEGRVVAFSIPADVIADLKLTGGLEHLHLETVMEVQVDTTKITPEQKWEYEYKKNIVRYEGIAGIKEFLGFNFFYWFGAPAVTGVAFYLDEDGYIFADFYYETGDKKTLYPTPHNDIKDLKGKPSKRSKAIEQKIGRI